MSHVRFLCSVVLFGLIGAASWAQSAESAKPAAAAPAVEPVDNSLAAAGQRLTDKEIDEAIAKGVKWLWSQQEKDGGWPFKEEADAKGVLHSVTGSRWPPGETCMALLALEYVNTPLDDPRFRRGMNLLREMELGYNYMISIRVVLNAHLYWRAPKEQRPSLRLAMKRDIDQIIKNQASAGGWRYGGAPPPRLIDFSNTQLCVLALSEAYRCGVEFPQEAVVRVHRRIIEDQIDDGGWNYGCGDDFRNVPAVPQLPKQISYGQMTAACEASLFLTSDMLSSGVGCPCKDGHSPRSKDAAGELALKRGMAWLNKEFRADTTPYSYQYYYWIYQVERVGLATGYRYFGEHDWYREIAAFVVAKQGADGSWSTSVDTAFALMFLVKGRAPVLYDKLEYDGDWNLHRHDLANLCKYVGAAKEQAIGWEVIQESNPVRLWQDAPVMFVSAESAIKMSEELKKKLRQYTDEGGTLLLESSCGAQAAKTFWAKTVKEIWPEWELQAVDKEHPVWASDVEMKGRHPNLMHLNDGVRSIIFYSLIDLSCPWQTEGVANGKELFDFGENLAAYASDKTRLRAKLSGQRLAAGAGLAGQTIHAGPKTAIKVGRLRHGGDFTTGWNYHGLAALGAFLNKQAGVETAISGDVDAATDGGLGTYDVLWATGRRDFDLSAGAQAKLKAALAGGKTFLVAESVLGDARFTAAATKVLTGLGLTTRALGVESELLTGRLGTASGYGLAGKARYSRSLEMSRIGQDTAALTGLFLDGKLVGVLSPYDVLYSLTGLKAWGRQGYEPDYAMAVGANLLLRATATEVAAPAATSATPAEEKP